MAVKRLYKAFANHLDEERKKTYKELVAENPQIAEVAVFQSSPEVQAIRSGDVSICEHFALKSDLKEGLEFSVPHSKSVTQTVRANIAAYNNILAALKEEKKPEYLKVYKSLKSAYDKYFALASEEVLEDVYGTEFTSFKADYEAKHSKAKA